MADTKQRIMAVSLELFSQKGFSAVSIRDICRRVGIKESSIYYHFKNKQAIFDALLERFEQVATNMMGTLARSITEQPVDTGKPFYQTANDTFFEAYLMDDFCNKTMRLLQIEQRGNATARKMYDRWMFEVPLQFQSQVFDTLMARKLILQADSGYLAVQYYAPIYLFAERWLLSGALTELQKKTFRHAARQHIERFFKAIEVTS